MYKLIRKILFLTLLSGPIFAANLYIGPSYSYGVSTAESDFWNGAEGTGPGILLGIKFEALSFEGGIRRNSLFKAQPYGTGEFQIDTDVTTVTFGLKYDILPNIHYGLGVMSQNVEITYSTNLTKTLNSSKISGTQMGVYAGGGVHFGLFIPDLTLSFDLYYFHKSIDFGLFTFEASLVYNVFTF